MTTLKQIKSSLTRHFLPALICTVLAGCNMPSEPAITNTPTPNLIATQISLLLTQAPTAVEPSLAVTASATVEPSPITVNTEVISTPTETALPTTITSTIEATLTNDPPDWRDTLDDGKSFYKYENENTRITQENGRLILTGVNANGWLGWSLTFSHKPTDFRIEAQFIPQTCSGADQYGILFRAPDTNSGYFYGITCDGRYYLHARNFNNNSDIVIINLTTSTAIQSGANATNRIGVKVVGNQIGLYANDALLQEVTDATYSDGNFGVFVAADETPGFSVWMEEISLWEIP